MKIYLFVALACIICFTDGYASQKLLFPKSSTDLETAEDNAFHFLLNLQEPRSLNEENIENKYTTTEAETTETTDTDESTTESTDTEDSTTESTDTDESTTESTDTEDSTTESTDTDDSTTETTDTDDSTTEAHNDQFALKTGLKLITLSIIFLTFF